MWLTVAALSATAVSLTTPWLNVYWIWTLLAMRGLDSAALEVVRELERGDLAQARLKLAMIVGRDTAELSEPEIMRGVIETVSENTSDGIIAPLLYLLIGGPAGMALYKAVNTMDSMAGYRNERYREFGWCAARMDDVFNFIPARLTAALVWVAAWILRLDARRSVRVTVRDARSQPSPNAGYPEAAYAGALGVRLGGMSTYAGVPSMKAYLGDAIAQANPETFRQVRKLLYCSSGLLVAAGLVLLR
jgi:adenosylcobinamide-phosphate synthase